MPEYEFVDVYVPRGVSRKDATRLLTDHAEYGHWELDRLSLHRDGSRRAGCAGCIIRQVRATW